MDDELLRRVDGHLAETTDYMRRGNELMERNTQAFLDLREYLQQATAALAGLTREIGGLTREIGRGREEFEAETRAQRQALFAVLDRLERGTGPSPA